MGTNTRRCAALLLSSAVLAGCADEVLYADLPEQQANEVHAVLLDAGIAAHKSASPSKKGWSIELPRAQFSAAMGTLRAHGLPGEVHQSLGDVFRKEGITSSPIEDRARFIHAREQELSQTLLEYDGVVAAHVHINLPASDPLAEEKEGASASVVIFHDPRQTRLPSAQDVEAIVMDAIGVHPGKIAQGESPRPPRVTVRFAARERPVAVAPTVAVRASMLPDMAAPVVLVIAVLIALGLLLRSGALSRLRLRRTDAQP